MPLYSAVYVPFVSPGQRFTCFDGTETPSAAIKSAAFMRGLAPAGFDGPFTFTIDFPSAPTSTVTIQASNTNVDANFQTIGTINNTQHGSFTDASTAWKFYRVVLTSYTSGGMPVVIAQHGGGIQLGRSGGGSGSIGTGPGGDILISSPLPNTGNVDRSYTYSIRFNNSLLASTAGSIAEVPLFTLLARGKITGITLKSTIAFTAPSLTALTVSVAAISGTVVSSPYTAATAYSPLYDLIAAVSDVNYYDDGGWSSATELAHSIVARFTASGANLNSLTAGSVDITIGTLTRPAGVVVA